MVENECGNIELPPEEVADDEPEHEGTDYTIRVSDGTAVELLGSGTTTVEEDGTLVVRGIDGTVDGIFPSGAWIYIVKTDEAHINA